jgi:hypothetical protein
LLSELSFMHVAAWLWIDIIYSGVDIYFWRRLRWSLLRKVLEVGGVRIKLLKLLSLFESLWCFLVMFFMDKIFWYKNILLVILKIWNLIFNIF